MQFHVLFIIYSDFWLPWNGLGLLRGQMHFYEIFTSQNNFQDELFSFKEERIYLKIHELGTKRINLKLIKFN